MITPIMVKNPQCDQVHQPCFDLNGKEGVRVFSIRSFHYLFCMLASIGRSHTICYIRTRIRRLQHMYTRWLSILHFAANGIWVVFV